MADEGKSEAAKSGNIADQPNEQELEGKGQPADSPETPPRAEETPTDAVKTCTEVAEAQAAAEEEQTEAADASSESAEAPIESAEAPTEAVEHPSEGAAAAEQPAVEELPCRDVEPRPFACSYQEAVWSILLRAYHAAYVPLADGVKRMLRRAYGRTKQRWLRIVREPLSRRHKEICYAEDDWLIEMTCQIIENELGAFCGELLPIEPDEPDPVLKMATVAQEVERVKLSRRWVVEKKEISAMEAKEVALSLHRLIRRTGSLPDPDPLWSSVEVLDALHRHREDMQNVAAIRDEDSRNPLREQDETVEEINRQPSVSINARDIGYILLLRIIEHMETVLPKIIPKAAKKTTKRDFDDMRGPLSEDLPELLSFFVHDDPAMDLIFLLMEDKYRTPEMKMHAFTVAKMRLLLWKHASIPVTVLAQGLDAAHAFLSVCQEDGDVELAKVEGWLDDFRHCIRPNRYRELRYRRHEDDGGEVELIVSDLPEKNNKRILIDTKGFAGRESLLKAVSIKLRSEGRVVLCGPHGIGKTALAIEIGNQLLLDCPHQYIIHSSTPGCISSNLAALLVTEGQLQADQNSDSTFVQSEFLQFMSDTKKSFFFIFDDCPDPQLVQPLHDLLPTRHLCIVTALKAKQWEELFPRAVYELGPLATHESLQVLGYAMTDERGELGIKGTVKYSSEVYDVPKSRAKVAEIAEVHLRNIPLDIRFMGYKLLEKDVRPDNLVEKLLDFEQPMLRRTDRGAGGPIHVKGYRNLVLDAFKKVVQDEPVKQLAYCLSIVSSRPWNPAFCRLLLFYLGMETDGVEECHLLEEAGLIQWVSEEKDSFTMSKLVQMHVCQHLGEEESIGKVSRESVIFAVSELADVLDVRAHGEAQVRSTVHTDFTIADFEQLLEDIIMHTGSSLTDEQLLEMTSLQLQCMRWRTIRNHELAAFLTKLEARLHARKIAPPIVVEDGDFNERTFGAALWILCDKDTLDATMFVAEQLDKDIENEVCLRLLAAAMGCLADKPPSQQAVVELANKFGVTQELLISLMDAPFGDVITSLALSLGHGLIRSQVKELETFTQKLLKKLAEKESPKDRRTSEEEQAVLTLQHLHVSQLCAVIGRSYRNGHQSNHALKWYTIARETLLSLPKKSYRVREMMVDFDREALHTCALMLFMDTKSSAVITTLQSLREDLHHLKLNLPSHLLVDLAEALLVVVQQRKDDLQKSAQELLKMVFIEQVCGSPQPPYLCFVKAIKAAADFDDKEMFQTVFFKASAQLAKKPTTAEYAQFVYDLYESLRTWHRQHFDKDLYCDVSVSLLCVVDELFLNYGFLHVNGKLLVMEMKRSVRKDRAAEAILSLSRLCETLGKKKVAELLTEQHDKLYKPDTPPPSPKPKTNDFWGRW